MLRQGLLGFVLLTATACHHDTVFTDEGTACLVGEGTASIVYPDRESPVLVQSPCASACAENVVTRCDVSVSGDQVTIDSLFAYDEPEGACIAVCGVLEARCTLPRLAEGDYVVRHGETTTQLRVGNVSPGCF